MRAKNNWAAEMKAPVHSGCPECAERHDPAEPHLQSTFYQVKFLAMHKRLPTWDDTMAHCTPEVQAVWRQAIKEISEDVA